jgi:hypothetical protein
LKVEIKNCLVVVVLLCLGFILGRTTILSDVNATPQESDIGRYQLIVGEIDLSKWFSNEKGVLDTTYDLRSGKTLFRIDTKTGNVDYHFIEECTSWGDTLSIWEHKWQTLTQTTIVRRRAGKTHIEIR